MDGRGVNGSGVDWVCDCVCDGGFGDVEGLEFWRRDARSCSSVVVVLGVLEVVLVLSVLFGLLGLSCRS